jgi:hypothetical protein
MTGPAVKSVFGATDRTPERGFAWGDPALGVRLAVPQSGPLPSRGEGQGGGPKKERPKA